MTEIAAKITSPVAQATIGLKAGDRVGYVSPFRFGTCEGEIVRCNEDGSYDIEVTIPRLVSGRDGSCGNPIRLCGIPTSQLVAAAEATATRRIPKLTQQGRRSRAGRHAR